MKIQTAVLRHNGVRQTWECPFTVARQATSNYAIKTLGTRFRSCHTANNKLLSRCCCDSNAGRISTASWFLIRLRAEWETGNQKQRRC